MDWPEIDADTFIASITPREHVEGVVTSCAAIQEFLADKGDADLASDRLLRAAVEMKFIHVGAALEELERKAPEEAQLIRHRPLFVKLYHDLAEDYDEDHTAVVWQYWQTLIADVHADAEAVLQSLPEESETEE
jgi:uncharacterized protein with HEPN domain